MTGATLKQIAAAKFYAACQNYAVAHANAAQDAESFIVAALTLHAAKGIVPKSLSRRATAIVRSLTQ